MCNDYHELHWDELMTAEQFCQYAREGYNYWLENLGESETQYRSECALYGDAGVGQGYHINQLRHMIHGVEATFKRLTGTELAHVAYPIGWEDDVQTVY